jgi:hypothetical protein
MGSKGSIVRSLLLAGLVLAAVAVEAGRGALREEDCLEKCAEVKEEDFSNCFKSCLWPLPLDRPVAVEEGTGAGRKQGDDGGSFLSGGLKPHCRTCHDPEPEVSVAETTGSGRQ